MSDEQTFLVYRNDGNGSPSYERYTVSVKSGMTILDALFYIQDHFDPSLAFRYACRGAICGSDALTINKWPRLACKTQIAFLKENEREKKKKIPELYFGEVPNWNEETEILIEPLPHMNVVKDLVVDMEPFWKFYREIMPYFDANWVDQAPEKKQTPKDAKSIEHLIYCVLCGACWACPVSAKNKNYLGPAQLAKAERFISDTRLSPEHREKVNSRVMKEDGVPACEKIYTCSRVCPKGVRPGTAIKKLRETT